MAGKSSAVSPDPMQHSLSERDENDIRNNHNNPKIDVPKKKTTFKITSVTKSSQRVGSGDLTHENDLDSQDDLDETVDSHTEDLSSEIYDTSSKATDIDIQEPPLTPEDFIRETEPREKPEESNKENEPKEKPARFKVVKVESKQPFKRGRWVCCDYLDAPEKTESKQEEINVKSGSSSAVNSVHYVHGVDDPSKNPLLAGATGTMPSLHQAVPLRDASASTLNGNSTQDEMFKPIHPAPSQPNLILDSHSNSSFSNMSAPSSSSLPYGAQAAKGDQSLGQSFPVINNLSLISGSTVPTLPPLQQGSTQTSQSLSGNIPFPSGQTQHLPTPQVSILPTSLHSQSGSVSGTVKSPLQVGEYVNSIGHGQVSASQGQPMHGLQQQRYDVSSQQSGYSLSSGAVSAAGNVGASIPGMLPQQNHMPASATSPYDGSYRSDTLHLSLSGSALSSLIPGRSEAGGEPRLALGAGLVPLEIAVGGITSAQAADDDVTEEAISHSTRQLPFASRRPSLRTQVRNHIGSIHSGTSAVAIDNKIEQAMVSQKSLQEQLAEMQKNSESLTDKLEASMDLVKSHLMYAVREEVEVLKELIKELMERMHKAEHENMVLRKEATPETLAKLPPPLPPVQNPLLQQFMVSLHTPSSS